jgi:murein DD-endopeptidase MepM/ murein hydrolase activator NlpD
MKHLYVWKDLYGKYFLKYNYKMCGFVMAALIYAGAMLSVLQITWNKFSLLKTELFVREMGQNGMDYDAFRDIRITEEIIEAINRKVKNIIYRYPNLRGIPAIDFTGYLTFSMMAYNYDLKKHGIVDETTFLRGIGKIAQTKTYKELYRCYHEVFSDLRYFPVPKVILGNKAGDISYCDTWYALRQYGGKRRHEGTDIMADNNIRGYFPVISITDGVVEKKGWLEKGGNRIGIRAKAGGYFYYAHLYSFAHELCVGDNVIAGQLLGFMGDSGYGAEGTVGQFDVHLHLGIYVQADIGDTSVNPYWILKALETKRLCYR